MVNKLDEQLGTWHGNDFFTPSLKWIMIGDSGYNTDIEKGCYFCVNIVLIYANI